MGFPLFEAEKAVYTKELISFAEDGVDHVLTDRDRKALEGTVHGLGLRDIGVTIDLSTERVRQVLLKIQRRLHEHCRLKAKAGKLDVRESLVGLAEKLRKKQEKDAADTILFKQKWAAIAHAREEARAAAKRVASEVHTMAGLRDILVAVHLCRILNLIEAGQKINNWPNGEALARPAIMFLWLQNNDLLQHIPAYRKGEAWEDFKRDCVIATTFLGHAQYARRIGNTTIPEWVFRQGKDIVDNWFWQRRVYVP